MDSLHVGLIRIEVAGLGPHHLPGEAGREILHYNSIAGCKEAKNVLDKILLGSVELLPVFHVLAQINLLGEPDDGLLLLAALPEIGMPDRKENKALLCV